MNKTIIALGLVFSLNAFSDCTDAYKKASHRRNVRNELIVVGASLASLGAIFLVPAGIVESALIINYTLTLTGAWPVASYQRQGEHYYNNNFDKELAFFSAATRGVQNKYLDRLLKKTARKMDLEALNEDQTKHAHQLLADGFKNDVFCPFVKVRKNGTEKRAVFHRSAVVDYLAANI